MIDYELSSLLTDNYKQIEDIIDARKKMGQYNVNKQTHTVNYRYAYSSSSGTADRFVRFDDTMLVNEGDFGNVKRTDSEVTVVRIRDNSHFKRRQSKWDMHDIAIPGDGSHLGESPSLVNLATLVAQNVQCEGDEYLVPLSSWDPYYKNEDQHPELSCCSKCPYQKYACVQPENTQGNSKNLTNQPSNCDSDSKIIVGIEGSEIFKRPSWAGRISKFLRKHCKNRKTLPETDSNGKN